MDHFWFFMRKMLRRRATVAWAIAFALLSAMGLGIGLMSMGPVLNTILTGKSLPQLAAEFNQKGGRFTIPQPVIDLLPVTPLGGVALVVAGVIVLTIVGGFFSFMHKYLSEALAAVTVAQIRQEVFSHVVHLPLVRVVTRGPSEFVSRIARDAAELHRGFIALTSKSITNVLKGVAALLAASWFHWQLSLSAIVAAPMLALVLRKLGKRIRRGTRGSLQAQEGLLRVATEIMHGLRAVKANTGERRALDWFHRINKVVFQNELRVRTARALTPPLVEITAITVLGALAILAAKHILSGTLPFKDFILSLTCLGMGLASFRPLSGLINEIQAAAAPAGRLAEILAQPMEGSSGLRLRNLPRHQVSVEFEDVTFRYPEADRPALDGITLRIAAGERVAFVGPNGSGKTTLLSLLPRLLEPAGGRVLVDGTDVATVNLRSLRRQIGAVTQETVLFRGTVADNIGFGCDAFGPEGRERIIEAARRAHADAFIRELPKGYDTDLAEAGASLSGGQRQRLAIARAILRDPAILILDEATSQIDAESEAHINAALAEFCRGRTALLIAHRLSTVHSADRIVVMDRGGIVAQGTHGRLLAGCDLYQRLTQTQLVAPV